MFQNTVLLMLLEAGIQAEAAKSLGEALRTPGIMVWREFVCVMIHANMPGTSAFERSRRSMEQLTVCAMALRRTFDPLWGINVAIELMKLERLGDSPMLTVLLPSAANQRALVRHRLRRS
jgi:hypothetical protein